jgi:hypothetical protein
MIDKLFVVGKTLQTTIFVASQTLHVKYSFGSYLLAEGFCVPLCKIHEILWLQAMPVGLFHGPSPGIPYSEALHAYPSPERQKKTL